MHSAHKLTRMHLLATLQYFDLGGLTIRQVWLSCTLFSGDGKSLLYESMTSSYCRRSSLVIESISAPIQSLGYPPPPEHGRPHLDGFGVPSLNSSTPGFVT